MKGMHNRRKTDKLNTINVNDYSDGSGFAFGFKCHICGSERRSEYTPFKYDGIAGYFDKKDLEYLWEEERRRAYDQAKQEAAVLFNRCPVCRAWVCDECFFVTDKDLTDLCTDCIEELGL